MAAAIKRLFNLLQAQHRDAAASVLESLDEMFTINAPVVTGVMARCVATTNITNIAEISNFVVRRVSAHVAQGCGHGDAPDWTASGFLEAEKSLRRCAVIRRSTWKSQLDAPEGAALWRSGKAQQCRGLAPVPARRSNAARAPQPSAQTFSCIRAGAPLCARGANDRADLSPVWLPCTESCAPATRYRDDLSARTGQPAPGVRSHWPSTSNS